jgi:hypothetical protein
MADSLDKYRKSPGLGRGGFAAPAATVAPGQIAPTPEAYVAFVAKDSVRRIRIRPAMAPWHAYYYEHLLDVSCDGNFGTNFVLYFTTATVLVRGRNLLPIIAALENGNADFIQEFHPAVWEKPADGTPIIESLEIESTDPSIAAQELRLSGEKKPNA